MRGLRESEKLVVVACGGGQRHFRESNVTMVERECVLTKNKEGCRVLLLTCPHRGGGATRCRKLRVVIRGGQQGESYPLEVEEMAEKKA